MLSAEPLEKPRLLAIVLAAFIGFLGGQIIAAVLDELGVAITHFPGGLSALSSANSPPWWANALGLLGLWVGFGAAIYFAYAYGNLTSLPDQWRPRVSDFLYVALGVGAQLLVDVAYSPFHIKQLNKPVHHLFASAQGLTFVVLIVMTLVLAPIMEEWLFRGVLFRALSEGGTNGGSRGAVIVAVVVSAALFALAHAEPLQFAGLFFLGIILATLVWRTSRLIPSIITHVSFNGVAIVALVSQRSGH
ncbi:MAG: CPBP family intramembrane glutamic endopeptidase [Acidimicrobiales bacterium]